MASEEPRTRFDDEIAAIENRQGKRNLFLVLGGLAALFLLVVVVFGARERMRLAEEAARPRVEPVELGSYVGTVANTAVFTDGRTLFYVEDVGNAEITSDTRFARPIAYDELGRPDSVPPGTAHWALTASDSLPYVIEPVTDPLTGVTRGEYTELPPLGSLRQDDYGSGGPRDWRPLELEETRVQVSGSAIREDGRVHLVEDPSRVRLEGWEGLTPIDSLELAWATENRARLTAFGRISATPPSGDPLFYLLVNAVEPPQPDGEPGGGAAPAPATDTAATGGAP